MSSSDSVAIANENNSRLGYKHVSINYLHVASHDCHLSVSGDPAHTHTHICTHLLTVSFYFFSLNSHLSFNMNSSGD